MNQNKTLAVNQLLQSFSHHEWFVELANRFLRESVQGQAFECHLDNLSNPSLKSLILASLLQHTRRPIILLCSEPQHVQKYRYELNQLLPDSAGSVTGSLVESYPTEDYTPYDLSITSVITLRDQYRILTRLKRQERFILIVSPKNLLLRHSSLGFLDREAIHLSVGQSLTPEQLVQQCLSLGYIKTSLVMEPGEFSSRGDIFDLYPVNGQAVRMEFFGDTLESMRLIDVENQRSIDTVGACVAIPRTGLILTDENKIALKTSMTQAYERQKSTLSAIDSEGLASTLESQFQALDQSFLPDGMEYYAPLLQPLTPENLSEYYPTLLDYLPSDAIAVVDDWLVLTNHLGGLSDRLQRQWEEGVHKGRLLDIGMRYHLSDTEALSLLRQKVNHRLYLETFPMETSVEGLLGSEAMLGKKAGPEKTANEPEQPTRMSLAHLVHQAPESFKADLPRAMASLAALRKDLWRIWITTDHPQRVLDHCKENDLPAFYWPEEGLSPDDASWHEQDVIISKQGVQDGFLLPEMRLAHFGDGELFGRKLKKQLIQKQATGRRDDIDVINSINDLRRGDYIVHIKHGVGQFIELAQIEMDGERREYLTIQYSGSDRLHVPVDQVNLLSRYRGAGDKPPKLSKMGGIEWSKVKGKVKKSVAFIAQDLMKLYAKRAKIAGIRFDPDTPWQVEMEEAFPYTETPDQWQAILDMKGDMESEKPMDRLICGDVGFGKTEVALRGIFKAVLSGKQVAVLVPTTILAQQHFNTLCERFQPYPVKVGLLSRFRSAKEQKEVIKRLVMGECDVVVGTHRLLQKDVQYKNLGLLVIDEEHRFGVSHKEKIKQMRAEVDVLTLSATPIPRTLYMSLSGVRDMSLIHTPPLNRSPIQTFVGPYNPAQIRMAILNEIDRGGQVYFVHNRVQTIHAMTEELRQLVPEVRFELAHGQMSGDELEGKMLDFAQKQYDVLVCTTIIESGLDIPNANTIIIDRADRFGLAQLYQLRGRVGRSNIQAHAYCYYDPDRMLSEDGKERLRAIREFTTLGSGYQIALRDLEIRGVGNILGSEQHGHMVSVGFDMYCQMLEEALQELQGISTKQSEPAVIDLNVTAFIPDEWVGDRDVKLSEYKRLAGVHSDRALEIIQAEWQDRFGEIPWQTKQLVELVRLRVLATELSISSVRADDQYLRIQIPFGLQEWMALQKRLPDELGRKTRWLPPVSSNSQYQPTLIIKHLGMDGAEQVQCVMTLLRGLQEMQQDMNELAKTAGASQE
ncbi:MAG: transcription-repair coupling factor [Cyanobacteria bacterium]|nr:transcription-repair coupling factor [Cyanobacteriota bacterium]